MLGYAKAHQPTHSVEILRKIVIKITDNIYFLAPSENFLRSKILIFAAKGFQDHKIFIVPQITAEHLTASRMKIYEIPSQLLRTKRFEEIRRDHSLALSLLDDLLCEGQFLNS